MVFDLLGVEIIFREAGMLWLFIGIPPLWLLAFLEARVRRRALLGPSMSLHTLTAKIPRHWVRVLWWFFLSIGLAFLVVVLSRPEIKITHWDAVYGKLRVAILFDDSLSMKYAEDLAPNRLSAAKSVVREFIDMLWTDADLKGKYSLALIPFAGTAQPFFAPFTTSREEILSNLSHLDEKVITKKGTSLWAALRAYDMLLLGYPPKDKKTVDIGILISDGGKEEGRGGEEDILAQLIKELRDPYRMQVLNEGEPVVTRSSEISRRVVLYSIGIGKVNIASDGSRVPAPVELVRRDAVGNFDYYREDETNPSSRSLRSTLDEDILRLVSREGGGEYFHFSDRAELLLRLKETILKQRHEIARVPRYQYESVRNWLIAPAFFIFYFLFGYGRWLVWLLRHSISRFRK